MLIAATLTAWLAAIGGERAGLPAPVWLALAAAAMLVGRGALWRLALGRQGRGLGGLQFGRVEARLAAVWALSGLFLAVLILLLFVALLCFAYAAASAGRGFDAARVLSWAPAVDGRGRLLLGIVAGLGGAGMVFAAARISLGEAASIERGRVQVLSTWALARGAVLPILVGQLAIALAPAAALVLAPPGGPWRLLQAVLLAGLWLPMSVGLMAYVFKDRAAQKADR